MNLCHRRFLPGALIVPILLSGIGSFAAGEPASRTLALVDGEPITVRELDLEISSMWLMIGSDPRMEIPSTDEILRRMIQNRLLEIEGYRVGLDSSFQVRNQVSEFSRHKSVMILLDSISAEALASGEDDLDSLMNVESRMNKLSHILVSDESVAVALLDSLAAGVSFGDLAGRHSIDTVSAVKRGDLGWAREGVFVDEFENGVAGLSPGEHSSPVPTQFGWHLILLDDTRLETAGQSEEMQTAVREAVRKEKVKEAIRGFVASLVEKYEAAVDDSLLESLDYASADPAVQEYLRSSEDVLLRSSVGSLTVRSLSRNIRFKYFHGLEGRAGADGVRDKMFDEYLAEVLLSYEANVRGLREKPELLRAAHGFERELLREEVLGLILKFSFGPDEKEQRLFYDTNRNLFVPDPKIKLQSAILESEERAKRFREGLESGAKVKWLASRTEGVVEVNPSLYTGWQEGSPEEFQGQSMESGKVLGPSEVWGGWLVAKVTAVEEAGPLPFDECRSQVLKQMKMRKNSEVLNEAMARLEESVEIEIVEGAHGIIDDRLRHWESEQSGAAAGGPGNE